MRTRDTTVVFGAVFPLFKFFVLDFGATRARVLLRATMVGQLVVLAAKRWWEGDVSQDGEIWIGGAIWVASRWKIEYLPTYLHIFLT